MKKLLFKYPVIGFLAIGSIALMNSCGSDEILLPSISKESSDDVPDEVLEKAQEVFNSRFAQVDDDYFQVYIKYADNIPATYKKSMEEAGVGQYGNVLNETLLKGIDNNLDPHLISASLFQLKDLTTTITANELTDADKLNNITWKGEVKVIANNMRSKKLDLMEQIRSLKTSSDTIDINYTSPKITLGVCGKSWVEHFNAEQEQKKSSNDDPLAMMDNVFGVLTNQIFEQLIPGLQGSDWSEWRESKEYTFQKCNIIVENGEVICQSEEDFSNFSNEKKSFSTLPILTGMGAMMYENLGDRYVATKPNIEFLQEHNILKNGSANNDE